MPASNEVQAARLSRSKNDSNPPPERSTKRRKTSTMRTRFNASKVSPDDTPVLHMESDPE